MNIHPILVHFPIALLAVYAMIEIIRVKRFTTEKAIHVKAILVIAGTLGAIASYLTGETAEDAVGTEELHALIERHEFFGMLSLILFGLLALSYFLVLLDGEVKVINKIKKILSPIWPYIDLYKKMTQKPFVLVLLSVLGFLALTITGALGGAISHGPDTDFIVQFIYNLFF